MRFEEWHLEQIACGRAVWTIIRLDRQSLTHDLNESLAVPFLCLSIGCSLRDLLNNLLYVFWFGYRPVDFGAARFCEYDTCALK
jgi:hypothetical protein